ncbi:MAG: hypothetical protein ACOX2F_12645 [bacterium]
MKSFFVAVVITFLMGTSIYADETYPNIAIVFTNDDGLIGVTEKSAANRFYMTHPDIYDFLFVFTTFASVTLFL